MIDSLNGRLRDVFKEVFGVDDIDDTVSVGTCTLGLAGSYYAHAGSRDRV